MSLDEYINRPLGRPTGIRPRTSPICPLHSGCCRDRDVLWPGRSSLCGWYTAPWQLSGFRCRGTFAISSPFHRSSSPMDGVKQASAESGQNSVYLVRYETTTREAKFDRLSSVSPTLVSDTHVRNLGVILDSELLMGDHISQLCRSCFFQLRRMRAIRHCLTQKSILMLAHSFICNRIDYCNSVVYGASRFQLDRLQSILNAAARIVLRIPKFSHISASIRVELHWLPVRFRPEFKICLFVRNCLVGTAPAYLQELCIAVSSSAGRRSLR